jgi:hypothetical protein
MLSGNSGKYEKDRNDDPPPRWSIRSGAYVSGVTEDMVKNILNKKIKP